MRNSSYKASRHVGTYGQQRHHKHSMLVLLDSILTCAQDKFGSQSGRGIQQGPIKCERPDRQWDDRAEGKGLHDIACMRRRLALCGCCFTCLPQCAHILEDALLSVSERPCFSCAWHLMMDAAAMMSRPAVLSSARAEMLRPRLHAT